MIKLLSLKQLLWISEFKVKLTSSSYRTTAKLKNVIVLVFKF